MQRRNGFFFNSQVDITLNINNNRGRYKDRLVTLNSSTKFQHDIH